MKKERRTFLKRASLAGAVLATASTAPGEARAVTAGPTLKLSGQMPKGMTLLTMRTDSGYTLGIKTDKGILDIAAAAKHYRSGAPTTSTATARRVGA